MDSIWSLTHYRTTRRDNTGKQKISKKTDIYLFQLSLFFICAVEPKRHYRELLSIALLVTNVLFCFMFYWLLA